MNLWMKLVMGGAMFIALSTPYAYAGDLRHDFRDIRHDRHDIQRDRRDIRHDITTGHFYEARRDIRDLRRDKFDVRNDRRDLRNDLRDFNQGVIMPVVG